MSTADRPYELRLDTGTVVTWYGRTGEDAARRYIDAHRTPTGGTYAVTAWREAERYGVFAVHPSQIIG